MKNKKLAQVLAIGFFAMGALLAVLGFNAGENVEIMRKGVTICLECIGIG